MIRPVARAGSWERGGTRARYGGEVQSPSKSTRIAVAAFVIAFGLWLALFAWREARSGDSFDLLRWELATVANKTLFALGAPMRDDPSPEDAVARYFALEDRDGDIARRLENVVEAAIEGRVDAAVREAGLSFALPLPGARAVWPPVDIELTRSPRVLVISPRAEIRRAGDHLLRADLATHERDAIERATEARDASISALAVPTGGVATYPAIVAASRSYPSTIATSAHEWVHHYLAFYPLGRALFGNDPDVLIINETVASIAGDELGDSVRARHGGPSAARAPANPPAIDRDEVLRDLHTEVDGLLAAGKVAEAERRMEEVRQLLADHGVYIRRINQAYFAFYGTYATRDDAIHPLGGQLLELRERAGSLARFIELVREVTAASEVEALLAGLDGGDGSQ